MRRSTVRLSVALTCLLWAGCDSKNPLSEPGQSKPDASLAGVWRQKGENGDVSYYHVGLSGDKLPESVMQIVSVTHAKDGHLEDPGVMLMFPTVLGSTAYLNVVNIEGRLSPVTVEALQKNAWKALQFQAYFIFKYRVEGDTLLLWGMSEAAKKEAITSGKIKGEVPGKGKTGASRFTDTKENLARFVVAAGDSLFEKEPLRLERVK
ncbi:MAG: hypothetical protein ABR915_25120 [Thermoguttaceae bacterium]